MTDRTDDRALQEIIAAAMASNDATAWFEELYAAAERGEATVPWDRHAPHQALAEWVARRDITGAGRRAVVVGCGTGDDAALIRQLGFATTAFDISASAIRAAERRYPEAGVEWVVASLLDLPGDWAGSFDLVVESQTIQALPPRLREESTVAVASLVAPGGTLFVQAVAAPDDAPRPNDPPWPLTRPEIDRFTAHGLDAVEISHAASATGPGPFRWLAEFRRPA